MTHRKGKSIPGRGNGEGKTSSCGGVSIYSRASTRINAAAGYWVREQWHGFEEESRVRVPWRLTSRQWEQFEFCPKYNGKAPLVITRERRSLMIFQSLAAGWRMDKRVPSSPRDDGGISGLEVAATDMERNGWS